MAIAPRMSATRDGAAAAIRMFWEWYYWLLIDALAAYNSPSSSHFFPQSPYPLSTKSMDTSEPM
jgi:hypothetical protein